MPASGRMMAGCSAGLDANRSSSVVGVDFIRDSNSPGSLVAGKKPPLLAGGRRRIPAQYSNVDARSCQGITELLRLLPLEVVGVDDLRLERLRALGGLGGTHRV